CLGIILVLGQYELLAVTIFGVRVMEDYYQLVPLSIYFPFMSLLLASGLVVWLFLTQSEERPWSGMPALGVWALFLVFALQGVIHSIGWNDSLAYYLNVICGSCVFWMLGTQLARDPAHLRRVFVLTTVLGTAVAIHGLIASATGIFLLATPSYSDY